MTSSSADMPAPPKRLTSAQWQKLWGIWQQDLERNETYTDLNGGSKKQRKIVDRYGGHNSPLIRFMNETYAQIIDLYAAIHQADNALKNTDVETRELKQAKQQADFNLALFVFEKSCQLQQEQPKGFELSKEWRRDIMTRGEREPSDEKIMKTAANRVMGAIIGRSINAFEIIMGQPRVSISHASAWKGPEAAGLSPSLEADEIKR